MVIGGKIRGNAPQLASYLLATGENERIMILDVDGHVNADAAHLKEMLYSMELNSELTRSSNSVYHAYINPNPDDTTDRAMTMEEWQQSVELLTEQLGYQDQRRVVVLHEKPGNRVHAHIVYERYNHEHGKMATYKHNYKAHDKARAEIEQTFNHKPTPQKNKNRASHKQSLTSIWQRTKTAEEFIKQAEANGYKIAKGTDRPFKVVDADGVSFNLMRKLDGVKTAEVKQRFAETPLPTEKQTIKEMQAAKQNRVDQQANSANHPLPDKPQQQTVLTAADASGSTKTPATEQSTQAEARQKFLQNIKDVRERNRSLAREITLSVLIALRVGFSFNEQQANDQRTALKQAFISCTQEMVASAVRPPPERRPEFIGTAQYYKPI